MGNNSSPQKNQDTLRTTTSEEYCQNTAKGNKTSLQEELDNLLKDLRNLTSEECYQNALIVMHEAPDDEYKGAFITILKSFVGDLQQQTPEALNEMQTKTKALRTFFLSLKSKQQIPHQTPAPVMKPLKVFLITDQTYGAHQQLLDHDLQLCDVVLRFCPVVSQVTSDMDSALRKIADGAQGKPVVLVLIHQPEKTDRKFPCINQEVQVLFHQTQNGLLLCPGNKKAVQILQTMGDLCMNKNQEAVPSNQAKSQNLQPPVPPGPVEKTLKVFLIITGQTHGAHQQLLDQLNAQGLRVTPTDDLQLCDVVLLFCPVVSRVASDVDSAVRNIPDGAQGKPVVLILMHHTRKSDKILNLTEWSEKFPCIKQEVQVLFHQTRNGLLQCPMNQEAVQNLQSMCDQYMNKNQKAVQSNQRDAKPQNLQSPVPSTPVMKPLKVFLINTGQAHGVHQQLNAQWPRVTPTNDLQLCDVVLLFSPVVSQVGPESADSKIPDGAQGKPVVLILMHQSQNGLLLCPRNQEAVQILQRMCDHFLNKNQESVNQGDGDHNKNENKNEK